MGSDYVYHTKHDEHVKIAMKTKEQLEKEYYSKSMFNERVLMKISSYWDPSLDDTLSNDDYNKWSMYHWYPNSFFGNKFIVSKLHWLFNRSMKGNVHEETVKVHENSHWLYRAPMAS